MGRPRGQSCSRFLSALPGEVGVGVTVDREFRVARLLARKIKRTSDLIFSLNFLASALTVSADPAEALSAGQLRDVCNVIAGELDNLVRQLGASQPTRGAPGAPRSHEPPS